MFLSILSFRNAPKSTERLALVALNLALDCFRQGKDDNATIEWLEERIAVMDISPFFDYRVGSKNSA